MNSEQSRRIAMFGLDGLDISLVRKWAAASDLPNFQDLFNTSAWSSYKDPPQHHSGTVWASAHTGHRPTDHDLIFDKRIVSGSYKTRLGWADDCKKEPFWKWFANTGWSIHLIDIPFYVPDPRLGGKQIHGWCQHDLAWRRDSVPSGLLRKQIRKHGEHPVRSCHDYTSNASSISQLCSALIQGIEQRSRMYKELLEDDDWDFFYAGFSEAHCAGHLMWHLCDETHPEYSKTLARELGQPLLKVYRAIDTALGELRSVIGDGSSFIIYLSHGMGANHSAVAVFPQILDKFNAHRSGKACDTDHVAEAPASNIVDRIWQSTVGRLPEATRGDLKRLLPISLRAWITQRREENIAQKRNSLSYSVAQDGFSAIRVNLVGREPAGLVAAGKEYIDYIDALISELEKLLNADTGEPVLEQVFRADSLINPLKLTGGNDLNIWWRKSAPIRTIESKTLGRFEILDREKRTGEHIMHGALIINDPGVIAGEKVIRDMSVIDIAPTICELAGVTAEEPFPGRSRIAEFRSQNSGTKIE